MKVLVIGNSPATAIAAIYLKTANVEVKVFRYTDIGLKFKETVLPGYMPNNETGGCSYLNDCFLQAEYVLKDEVITVNSIDSISGNSIIINGTSHEYDYVIIDKSSSQIQSGDKIFSIKEHLEKEENLQEEIYYEALILAGTGCKVASKLIEQFH